MTTISAPVHERLRTEHVAWLTTITRAGGPVPTPVWFCPDGGDIVVYCSPAARKVANIGRQPQVTLSLNCDRQGRRVVVVHGRATLRGGADPVRNEAYMAKYEPLIAARGLTVAEFAELSSVEIRITPTRAWFGPGKLSHAREAAPPRPRTADLPPADEPARQAATQVLRLSTGYKLSRVMSTVIELGVPDLLLDNDGTATVADLATLTNVDPRVMALLLRMLTDEGLLREDPPGTVSLTTTGSRLAAKAPGSVRATVLAGMQPWHWDLWAHLTDAVRDGAPVMRTVFGEDFYAYLASHHELRLRWQAMLKSYAARHYPQVVAAYDFAAAGHIVDVGGGGSALLLEVLRRVPAARGAILDLPCEAAPIREAVADAGLADRCAVVGADMFRDPLPPADLYLLSGVVNDWPTAQVAALLTRCAAAAADGGRVLVVGTVSPPDRSRNPGMDLELLLTTGGWERTAAEYVELLGRSGLSVSRTIQANPLTIFEAVADGAGARRGAGE
jgi:PPOX class probable F420-dependent enzyme